MMNNTVLEILKQVVTDDESKLIPQAKLIDDLGCDSLVSVEIIMELEDKLGITITDDEVSKIVSIQDIINIVEAKTQ